MGLLTGLITVCDALFFGVVGNDMPAGIEAGNIANGNDAYVDKVTAMRCIEVDVLEIVQQMLIADIVMASNACTISIYLIRGVYFFL